MDSLPQKHCSTCDSIKPVSDFYKCRSREDGLWFECKACACARSRKWRREHSERGREIQKGTRERRKAKNIHYERRTEGTKYCTGCLKDKPVSEFYKNKKSPDGLKYHCADCARAEYQKRDKARERANRRRWSERNREKELKRRARYRERHREKIREKRRIYSRQNRDKQLERTMRRNARKRAARVGRVSYKRIWERDQGICYICGLKVERESCHFDHIVPLAKGGAHSESNIAVTHSWCNQQKGAKLVKYCQEKLL